MESAAVGGRGGMENVRTWRFRGGVRTSTEGWWVWCPHTVGGKELVGFLIIVASGLMIRAYNHERMRRVLEKWRKGATDLKRRMYIGLSKCPVND